MTVDRFTSSGVQVRNSQRTEQFHASASGGAVTNTNIDLGARSLIAQLLAIPGSTGDISPDDGITADGLQWQNQTANAIPVPNPATEANMVTAGFTDVTQGGGASGLNTIGPWTGVATAGDKFGLNPVTGDRYYVDNAGNWQAHTEADLDTTRDTVAGSAPAQDTIPAAVTGQTGRDVGDFHISTFDDFEVAYRFTAVNPNTVIEQTRKDLATGAHEYIEITATQALTPHPKAGWRREYGINFTAPTVTVLTEPAVPLTVPDVAVSGQIIDVLRHRDVPVYLNMNHVQKDSTVNPDGVRMNITSADDDFVRLTSVANTGWRVNL